MARSFLVPLAFREAAEGDEADQGDDEPDPEAPHDHQHDADNDEDATEPDAACVAASAWFRHECLLEEVIRSRGRVPAVGMSIPLFPVGRAFPANDVAAARSAGGL